MTDLHYVTDDERDEEHRQFFTEMAAAGTPFCERGCFVPLPPDGACRLCEPGQTPSDVNAAYTIHHGHGDVLYPFDERAAADQLVKAYERIVHQVLRDEKTPANGCRWCGMVEYGHGTRYTHGPGYHTWQAPTDATRLGRMLARRAGADMRLWREVNRRWHLRAVAGETR